MLSSGASWLKGRGLPRLDCVFLEERALAARIMAGEQFLDESEDDTPLPFLFATPLIGTISGASFFGLRG